MRVFLVRAVVVALMLSASVSTAFAATTVTDRYDATFRKYAKRYFGPAFDWRLFKAQAIAESNLQMRVRSSAGARGIMQLLPSTFKEMRMRNPEIAGHWDHPEWNIAAGIALSRFLWTQWTKDSVEHLREFTLSSYNAGRNTLLRAQEVAKTHALNPRLWPSIERVAPNVPRWRHSETMNYISRISANLAAMDHRGRIATR